MNKNAKEIEFYNFRKISFDKEIKIKDILFNKVIKRTYFLKQTKIKQFRNDIYMKIVWQRNSNWGI